MVHGRSGWYGGPYTMGRSSLVLITSRLRVRSLRPSRVVSSLLLLKSRVPPTITERKIRSKKFRFLFKLEEKLPKRLMVLINVTDQ